MKQIEINPSNKPYYSKGFIMGFECGTKEQYDADIHRIKQAREEMAQLSNVNPTLLD